jgi:hypothetical protein
VKARSAKTVTKRLYNSQQEKKKIAAAGGIDPLGLSAPSALKTEPCTNRGQRSTEKAGSTPYKPSSHRWRGTVVRPEAHCLRSRPAAWRLRLCTS